MSPAGQLARSKTASLAHRVKALQMEVADKPNTSKGAMRAPKTVGSPEGQVVRSKTTCLGKTEHQGNPNKFQVKAPLAELQSESEESNDDWSNQGKAQADIREVNDDVKENEEANDGKALEYKSNREDEAKFALLRHKMDKLDWQMEVEDAPNASKGATRAPKTVGSPAGRVVRSKTTLTGLTNYQGDPNKDQVKAVLLELQSESKESIDDRSNQ